MKYKLIAIGVVGLCLVAALATIPAIFLTKCYRGEEKAYVYLTNDDTPETVRRKLTGMGVRTLGYDMLVSALDYKVRSGRYPI